MSTYEDSASRWQRRRDGSWSPLPRPKSPPVRTQGLIETVAAQGGEITAAEARLTAAEDRLVALEATIADPDWIDLPLLNGWVDYGSIYSRPRFRKYDDGTVEIRGLVKSGTASDVAQLPAGYRPGQDLIFATTTSPSVYCRLDVKSSGELRLPGSYDNGFLSVSLPRFYADQ